MLKNFILSSVLEFISSQPKNFSLGQYFPTLQSSNIIDIMVICRGVANEFL